MGGGKLKMGFVLLGERSERDTTPGNTIKNWGYCVCLRGLPLPIPPQKKILLFNDPVYSRKLIVYPTLLGCF